MIEKTEIRSKALDTRKSIPSALRAQKSSKISSNLEDLDIFKDAEHVLFYYSFGAEVDTIPLINKYVKKKHIYLPRLVDKNNFIALPFHNFDTLIKSGLDIPEPIPKEDESRYENKLDLVIVPGLAFDRNGNRLGMGKGCYDRYLSGLPHAYRIGLAFEEQMLDKVPKDTYDEPVNIIITDENIYRI